MYGLYGLKHHIVEKMLDVTLVDGRTDGRTTECEDRARILPRFSSVVGSVISA